MFETVSSDAEFRRVRALAYVDLNRYIGRRLNSDWKPRVGDLRNVGLELSCRQPRRTRRRFDDDNFSVSLSFINEKLVLCVHLRDGKTACADDANNSKPFHSDVSGHRFTVPSFNSDSKSGSPEGQMRLVRGISKDDAVARTPPFLSPVKWFTCGISNGRFDLFKPSGRCCWQITFLTHHFCASVGNLCISIMAADVRRYGNYGRYGLAGCETQHSFNSPEPLP